MSKQALLQPQDIAHLSHQMLAAAQNGRPADDDDDMGSSDGDDGGGKPARQGRRKIKIEYIHDKSRRHITFSKRKAGIMKKAYELSTLTGTQVLLLVASETGHVYTFATPKLQPIITREQGKNLIQACLNSDPSELDDESGAAGPPEDPEPAPAPPPPKPAAAPSAPRKPRRSAKPSPAATPPAVSTPPTEPASKPPTPPPAATATPLLHGGDPYTPPLNYSPVYTFPSQQQQPQAVSMPYLVQGANGQLFYALSSPGVQGLGGLGQFVMVGGEGYGGQQLVLLQQPAEAVVPQEEEKVKIKRQRGE
ncbi:hypothetical protein DFJ74DRAFT_660528 [Hyaloraphidium curvatum]|nr:hypothetical protein DFJ74DRAFT_660528 [Hyaloraphidium curvatum]